MERSVFVVFELKHGGRYLEVAAQLLAVFRLAVDKQQSPLPANLVRYLVEERQDAVRVLLAIGKQREDVCSGLEDLLPGFVVADRVHVLESRAGSAGEEDRE